MQWPTHDVSNQAPDLHGYNLFTTDIALTDGVRRAGGLHEADLIRFGAELGTQQTLHPGYLANHHLPELPTHDGFGNRFDFVEFHPSWHRLLDMQWREHLHIPETAPMWRAPQPISCRRRLSPVRCARLR